MYSNVLSYSVVLVNSEGLALKDTEMLRGERRVSRDGANTPSNLRPSVSRRQLQERHDEMRRPLSTAGVAYGRGNLLAATGAVPLMLLSTNRLRPI